MILILILVLVVILFSIIELNIVQEMTIDFALFTIGPFPMFYFIIASIFIGALCLIPTTLKYYFGYKKALSYIRKKEKEELKFEKELNNDINFE